MIEKEISKILRKHREELNEEDVCICGWTGTAELDYPAHVAEMTVAELGLTEFQCGDRWWSTKYYPL